MKNRAAQLRHTSHPLGPTHHNRAYHGRGRAGCACHTYHGATLLTTSLLHYFTTSLLCTTTLLYYCTTILLYQVENIFINQLYDDVLQEGLPPAAWHAFLRQEMPSPPSTPPAASSHRDGGEGGLGIDPHDPFGEPPRAPLGLKGIAQLQRWGSRSRHGAAVRRVALPFESQESGDDGGDVLSDGSDGGDGHESARANPHRSVSAPGRRAHAVSDPGPRGLSLSRAALPPTSEGLAMMLPLAPLAHHSSPQHHSPPLRSARTAQRVSFSGSSPASSLDLGRSGHGHGHGLGLGRSPTSLRGSGSTSGGNPARRTSFQPVRDLSARWQRSDAAREATAEAHLAADAADVMASHARDAGARAAEAQQSVSDLMAAFRHSAPPQLPVSHYA